MSAENWAICPKCKRLDEEKRQLLADQIKTSYGNLPESEYLELVERFKAPAKIEETLREDYELGIWNKEFSISYGANCDKCGFEYSFNFSKEVGI